MRTFFKGLDDIATVISYLVALPLVLIIWLALDDCKKVQKWWLENMVKFNEAKH